jgi:hypothetical protein
LEALFVNLHVGENNHGDEAYDEDNLHLSVEEALQNTRASEWKEAMRTKTDALKKNNTWIVTPPAIGKNVISCKWVLTKKCDMNGNITIFKVRLVA